VTCRSLDLLRDVLDHEMVDVDGVSCGMVDDIELSNTPRGPAVTALLVGPGAWSPRLPACLDWPVKKLFGRQVVRVPWQEVTEIGEVIKLRSTAGSLRLGRLDRKVGAWLSRLPKL
jgi:sporulation protein YlmC with PRC-barrel domain